MKKQLRIRKMQPPKEYQLCRLYEQIGRHLKQLDRPADAAAIQRQKPRTVPATLIEMIF